MRVVEKLLGVGASPCVFSYHGSPSRHGRCSPGLVGYDNWLVAWGSWSRYRGNAHSRRAYWRSSDPRGEFTCNRRRLVVPKSPARRSPTTAAIHAFWSYPAQPFWTQTCSFRKMADKTSEVDGYCCFGSWAHYDAHTQCFGALLGQLQLASLWAVAITGNTDADKEAYYAVQAKETHEVWIGNPRGASPLKRELYDITKKGPIMIFGTIGCYSQLPEPSLLRRTPS